MSSWQQLRTLDILKAASGPDFLAGASLDVGPQDPLSAADLSVAD